MVGLIIDYFQFKIASRSKDALIVKNRYGHSNHYKVFCIKEKNGVLYL